MIPGELITDGADHALNPGRRSVSAYKLSDGKKRIAKSVVCGGAMYFALISFAWLRKRVSKALPAAAMPSVSPASVASIKR